MAHRQGTLMAISERVGAPRYRFFLQNASKGLLQMFYAPDGWKDAKFQMKRNPVYHGLFRAITFNQLTFKKDSRDFIRDVYETQGINAVVFFIVERMDDTTGDYTTYFSGKLDLSTYKIEESGVTCQIIDTQLAEKIKTRETVKVNLRDRISIEGYEIPPFSEEDPELNFPAYEISAHTTWGPRANNSTTLDNHYAPLWLGLSEFTEAQSQNCDTPIADDQGMFINSAADRDIHITGRLTGRCEFSSILPHVTFTLKIFVAGVAVHTIGTVSGNSVNQLNFDFIFTDDFAVLTGQDFWIQGTVDHSGETFYIGVQVEISEVQESLPTASCVGYPYYEAFLRNLQLITDSYDILYSTKFGRTDSEITTYPSDGQLGSITKGYFLRNAFGFNNAISISFQDLFKSLSSLFAIGMGIESVGGVDKVVIEDIEYFYSSTVVLDVSSRIRENAIVKEVMPEKHYNKINTGYNSFEYLTAGGLAEYNTKSEFTTVISVVDNGFENISKYRADTQGIILLRKAFGADEDVKGDEDIFLVDTVRRGSPYNDFIARTSEDFILITGGADADNSLNLDYTPKRNLLRNGFLIRAGLEKNLGTYIRWQAGDKNTTLVTQRTAEADPLVENADILVNDLEEPFFLPEQYSIQCELRYTDLTAILANPKGLVKLSDTKYGWVLDLSIGAKENLADIKLLRANLNVITPIETVAPTIETIHFGLIYNWYAYTDVRNLANTGWHTATQAEYDTLMLYLGDWTVAGGKMKDTDTTYWTAPNAFADNSSKFNARGGGLRRITTGFIYLKETGTLWTEMYNGISLGGDSANEGWLNVANEYFDPYSVERVETGCSARLVKDSTTLSDGQEGTYIGNDGKLYRTICIGTQEWLADNLAETKYRNGDTIPEVTDQSAWDALTTGALCAYDNDWNNV